MGFNLVCSQTKLKGVHDFSNFVLSKREESKYLSCKKLEFMMLKDFKTQCDNEQIF